MLLIYKKWVKLSLFLFILLFLFSSISITIKADENQLILNIINSEEVPIFEIYENEEFKVSAYIISDDHTPKFQQNVSITFNGKSFLLTVIDPEIILIAPDVTSDTILNITGYKPGLKTVNQTITIINKNYLKIIPESYTLEANKRFSIVITDEDDNPISGVIVGIQSYSGANTIDTTNDYGRAWLTAPETRDEIVVKAQKEGYIDSTTTIVVNVNPTFIEDLINNSYAPYFLAAFLLVIAILIVYVKQKKTSDLSISKKSNKKNMKYLSSIQNKKFDHKRNDKIESQKIKIVISKEPKIEEIRITKPKKYKEIIESKDEIKRDNKGVDLSKIKPNKSNCNWFEGTEDFRYQIDKMTGKIDEKGKDKWFEGKTDIRKAIDNTIKKRDRQKEKK